MKFSHHKYNENTYADEIYDSQEQNTIFFPIGLPLTLKIFVVVFCTSSIPQHSGLWAMHLRVGGSISAIWLLQTKRKIHKIGLD